LRPPYYYENTKIQEARLVETGDEIRCMLATSYKRICQWSS